MTLIQVFYVIGIIFGTFFLFLNVAVFFGGDLDDGDIDGDIDGGSGIFGEALTLRSLINFLTFFGWVGVFCLEQNYDMWLSVGISTVVSMLLTIGFASIMFGMKKLQSTQSEISDSEMLNQQATVYLVIPGNDKKGKIQLSVRGSFRTIDALSETGERIETNSQVVVTSFISDSLVKVKLN